MINYVREREAFYEWLTFNTLSTSAQSLWNALFTICNAKGWPDGFMKVPDMMLRSYMHVSHDALLDARNQLKNKGLLDFVKGERRASSAAYKLVFFTAETDFCTEKADKGADKPADNGADKPADNGADKPADTYKLNINQGKTKRETEDDDEVEGMFARAMDAAARTVQQSFRSCIGREATTAEANRLALAAVNMEVTGFIFRAIEISAVNGAKNPVQYATTLLSDWSVQCLKTEAELDEYITLSDYARGHILGDSEGAVRKIQQNREARYQRKWGVDSHESSETDREDATQCR